MILQPYHTHPASSENVWNYTPLWTIVLKKIKYYVCKSQIITCVMCSFRQTLVTATGHGRIIMPGSKNYYVDRKWGQAIGESSSPSNSGRSSRERARVLTQIRKRHAIGRGREGVLLPKRNETQKVSFELRQGRERSPFHGVRWKRKF